MRLTPSKWRPMRGSVAERVSEGRFYVACIGQFKRGKSSVLNALVATAYCLPESCRSPQFQQSSVTAAVQSLGVRFEAGEWTDFLLRPLIE